jgi:flavin-dependent dehydrogenase
MRPLRTIDVGQAASTMWDVAVVGAGPAGAMTAFLLARSGFSTLVIERANLPRWKVCGACLNESALATLRKTGLTSLLGRLPGVPLETLLLFCRGAKAKLPLGASHVVSRSRFDFDLLSAAVEQGASVLVGVAARLGALRPDHREIRIGHDASSPAIQARVIVIAAGLGGEALLHVRPTPSTAAASPRIGIGCVYATAPLFYAPGCIYMAVGEDGYVGLVRQENGSLNVAAAVDRSAIRRAGSPAEVICGLLDSLHLPHGGFRRARWQGTATLERQPTRVGDERVFLVGDSAGYVEPFTGEGIAWALEGAVCVAPLVAQASAQWDDSLLQQWQAEHRRALAGRHRICSLVAAGLRHASWVAAATRLVAAFPVLNRPLVRYLGNQTLAP